MILVFGGLFLFFILPLVGGLFFTTETQVEVYPVVIPVEYGASSVDYHYSESFVQLEPEDYFYVSPYVSNTSATIIYELSIKGYISVLVLTGFEFSNWNNFRSYSAHYRSDRLSVGGEQVVHTIDNLEPEREYYFVLYNDPSLNSDESIVLNEVRVLTTVMSFDNYSMGESTIYETETRVFNTGPSPILVILLIVGGIFFVGLVFGTRKSKMTGMTHQQESPVIDADEMGRSPDYGQPAPKVDQHVCNMCGAPFVDGDIFCSNCGTKLS